MKVFCSTKPPFNTRPSETHRPNKFGDSHRSPYVFSFTYACVSSRHLISVSFLGTMALQSLPAKKQLTLLVMLCSNTLFQGLPRRNARWQRNIPYVGQSKGSRYIKQRIALIVSLRFQCSLIGDEVKNFCDLKDFSKRMVTLFPCVCHSYHLSQLQRLAMDFDFF